MNESRDPILTVREITKTYGKTKALRGVDFEQYPGEVVALLGLNGAGKSTLIKILAGAEQPTAGRMTLNGAPYHPKDPAQAASGGLQVVHQHRTLIPNLTVAENVMLGQEPSAIGMISRQELHNHVKVLADELGVSIDVKARINDLGAGERQMVDILKSLRSSGSVLLLDEPTAALSQRERQTLFGLIRQLKSQGLSILFVSHQLDEVFEVCDRIVCLRDGGVVSNRLIGESHIDQVIADIAGEENLNNFSRSVNSFPGETAIQIVSTKDGEVGLNVKTGEVVGLAGAVGSGCTELIEFISGSGKSPGRRLTVRGGAANYKNAAEARGDHIVLLPEKRAEKGVWSSLTLRENVSIGTLDKVSRGGFVSRRREHELVSSLTKSLMIKTPSLNTQISALSGGNQQKAVFARVLGQAADPQGAVFCFDEPTEGVDVRTKPEIAEQICRLSDQGAAVIVASSDLDELINMTDRIYVLREGIVVEEFEAQLHNRDAIVSRMLSQGEDRAVDAPRQGQ